MAALVALVGSPPAIGHKPDDEFTVPGSHSQRALDRMKTEFSAAWARVRGSSPEPLPPRALSQARYRAAIERTLAAVRKAPQVGAVVDPFAAGTVTANRKTALAQALYPVTGTDLHSGMLDALQQTDRSSGRPDCLGGHLRLCSPRGRRCSTQV
jgi:RND superfamily putative drug exporter